MRFRDTTSMIARIPGMVFLALSLLLASGCAVLPVRQEAPPIDYYSLTHIPTLGEEKPLDPDDIADLEPGERNTIEVSDRHNRAVVNITSITMSPLWLFGPAPSQGTGSGVIIDAAGVVVTNFHVVKNAEKLIVTLFDGTDYQAEIVGLDPENDLAVIRFDAPDYLPATIPLGSSEDLYVGQKVIALGNPFGLQRTLTTGVISGLKRPVQTQEGFIIKDLVQTDAAINPGNSGGPLLNSRGELIGINTMIISPSGGSIGIGFAIPIDSIQRIVPELLEHGAVVRGWIDIAPVPLYPRLARQLGAPTDWGILVSEVQPGGPAEESGLQGGNRNQYRNVGGMRLYLGGDVILSIDGNPVPTIADYLGALERSKPGEAVDVEVLRGTRRLSLRLVLSERPENLLW
jgi:S1-C subfamily serine protease